MQATFLGATWTAWVSRFLRPVALICALIWLITDAVGVNLLLRPETWFNIAVLFLAFSVLGMLEALLSK